MRAVAADEAVRSAADDDGAVRKTETGAWPRAQSDLAPGSYTMARDVESTLADLSVATHVAEWARFDSVVV